jgi:integrase
MDQSIEDFPWFVKEYFLKKKLTDATKKAYLFDLVCFFEWLGKEKLCSPVLSEISLKDLNNLTTKDIMFYKNYLENYKQYSCKNVVGLSPATVAKNLSAISSLFHYLANIAEYSDGTSYIEKNVLYYMKRNNTKKADHTKAFENKDKLLVTNEELDHFRDFIRNGYGEIDSSNRESLYYERNRERDSAIISLLMYSGLRMRQIINLKIDDINLEAKHLIIPINQKQLRKIKLNNVLIYDLKSYLKKRTSIDPLHKNLFFTRYKKVDSTMSIRTIQKIVNKYSSAYEKNGLTPQKLRHSFATVLFDETRSTANLQRELNQERINPVWFTVIYTRRKGNYNIAFPNRLRIPGCLSIRDK